VSQDSKRTVSEAGAEETVTQVEQATVESPHPKAVVTVVEKPAMEAAGGSTVQDTALVVVSTSLPCPPPAGQSSDN
jgi:predicted phage tail protein